MGASPGVRGIEVKWEVEGQMVRRSFHKATYSKHCRAIYSLYGSCESVQWKSYRSTVYKQLQLWNQVTLCDCLKLRIPGFSDLPLSLENEARPRDHVFLGGRLCTDSVGSKYRFSRERTNEPEVGTKILCLEVERVPTRRDSTTPLRWCLFSSFWFSFHFSLSILLLVFFSRSPIK